MNTAPAGWYPDTSPGAPAGRMRYWDGASWTERVHPTIAVAAPRARTGLGPGTGFWAGGLSGAAGGLLSHQLASTDTVLRMEANQQFMTVFGTYAAVLGAILLATHAAKSRPETTAGWFLGGAVLGGGGGALASLGFIKAIVEPVLERTIRVDSFDDIKNAYTLALALTLASIGLCIGLALGVARGGRGALASGFSGAVAGAIGGAAYAQVIYTDQYRSEGEVRLLTVLLLSGVGAAIGLALGATGPSTETSVAAPPSSGDVLHVPPARFEVPGPPAPAPTPAKWSPPAPPTSAQPPLAPQSPLVAPPEIATPSMAAASSPPAAAGSHWDEPPVEAIDMNATMATDTFAALRNARRSFAVELANGRRISIGAVGLLLGRDPAPAPGDRPDVHRVALPDPDRNLSRTHVAFRLDGPKLVVTDRGSTNGSAVLHLDGRMAPLLPMTPTAIEIGETVLFGTERARVVSE